MHEWQYYHIVGELRQRGHKVTYFNPVTVLGHTGSSEEYSDLLLKEIKKASDKHRVNIFFTTVSQDIIEANTIQQISKMGIPTVLMCCDDLSVPFIHKRIAKYFDLVWGTSRESQNILKSYGARTIMMPYAANPYLYKPKKVKEEHVVGFIGRCYGARGIHLASIASAGIPVHIYGKSPDTFYGKADATSTPLTRAFRSLRSTSLYVYQSLRFPIGRRCVIAALKRSFLEYFDHPSINSKLPDSVSLFQGLPFEDMGEYYSKLALSFGSMELHSSYTLKKPIMCIHLREFEAPMCGAVHLTNRWPELQEYFEEDKEMLFYGSKEELLDKIRYYLSPNRDTQRLKIRNKARHRAQNEHSWNHRFNNIWLNLGLCRQ